MSQFSNLTTKEMKKNDFRNKYMLDKIDDINRKIHTKNTTESVNKTNSTNSTSANSDLPNAGISTNNSAEFSIQSTALSAVKDDEAFLFNSSRQSSKTLFDSVFEFGCTPCTHS